MNPLFYSQNCSALGPELGPAVDFAVAALRSVDYEPSIKRQLVDFQTVCGINLAT
jgi:hypothetical protein